jgi:hypothetical protein
MGMLFSVRGFMRTGAEGSVEVQDSGKGPDDERAIFFRLPKQSLIGLQIQLLPDELRDGGLSAFVDGGCKHEHIPPAAGY